MTLLTTIILFIIAIQMNELWMIIGMILLMTFLTKDFLTMIMLGLAAFVIWAVMSGNFSNYLPFVIVAIIIIAAGIGIKPSEGEPETYSPDMGGLEGLMGGGADYGGMGGLGGY